MSTIREKLDQLYAHADEAEEFERLAAEATTADLRAQLQVISQWLAARWVQEFGALVEQANPEVLSSILAELRDRLATVQFDQGQQLTYWAQRAMALGSEQAVREMNLAMPLPVDASISHEATAVIKDVGFSVTDRIARARRIAQAICSGTHDDVMMAVAAAYRAVHDVERASRWITNHEVNYGSWQVASSLNAGSMWVAERNACLHCIAYSGVVASSGNSFPPDLTYGSRPLTPWPNGVLRRPPLHPNCRCRITVWLGSDTDYSLSDALKREARRSVLKGWSLPSESEGARLQAADRLLRRGAALPKSVEEQARRAVRRGHFVSRTVPKL